MEFVVLNKNAIPGGLLQEGKCPHQIMSWNGFPTLSQQIRNKFILKFVVSSCLDFLSKPVHLLHVCLIDVYFKFLFQFFLFQKLETYTAN